MPSEVIATLNSFQQIHRPPVQGLKCPQVWANLSGEWVDVAPSLKCSDPEDIYQVLFRYSVECAEIPSAFVVVTTGWASPLGSDGKVEGRPSEHPLRSRIALTVGALPSGEIASRIDFAGREGEPVDDEGLATGSLAEAVDLLAFGLWGRQFTQGIISRWVEGRGVLPEDVLRALGARVARFASLVGAGDSEGGAL